MLFVGMMHVFYVHLNSLTDRVKLGVLPPIIDKHSEWINAKTAATFISAVHVHCAKTVDEPLMNYIYRLLDVPMYSDEDTSNNAFYIAISHCPDIYYAQRCHVPQHMNTDHPLVMFLVVHALYDAGKLTAELIEYIYCVLLPTCDKSHITWYNIVTTFLDDVRRTVTISSVLLNEKKRSQLIGIESVRVCCLKRTYYVADWTVEKQDRKLGTRFVHSALEEHTCSTDKCNNYRYISKKAAIEVSADVLRNGQNMPP